MGGWVGMKVRLYWNGMEYSIYGSKTSICKRKLT